MTGKHKGYAFVEYDCPEAAAMAIEQMDKQMVDGRSIKVGRPNSWTQAAPTVQKMMADPRNKCVCACLSSLALALAGCGCVWPQVTFLCDVSSASPTCWNPRVAATGTFLTRALHAVCVAGPAFTLQASTPNCLKLIFGTSSARSRQMTRLCRASYARTRQAPHQGNTRGTVVSRTLCLAALCSCVAPYKTARVMCYAVPTRHDT